MTCDETPADGRRRRPDNARVQQQAEQVATLEPPRGGGGAGAGAAAAGAAGHKERVIMPTKHNDKKVIAKARAAASVRKTAIAEEQLTKLFDTRRWIYYVGPDTYDPKEGYRVSIVFERTAGHYPTGTRDKRPWHWGHDLDKAEEIANEMNAKRGIGAKEALIILCSSMGAT